MSLCRPIFWEPAGGWKFVLELGPACSPPPSRMQLEYGTVRYRRYLVHSYVESIPINALKTNSWVPTTGALRARQQRRTLSNRVLFSSRPRAPTHGAHTALCFPTPTPTHFCLLVEKGGLVVNELRSVRTKSCTICQRRLRVDSRYQLADSDVNQRLRPTVVSRRSTDSGTLTMFALRPPHFTRSSTRGTVLSTYQAILPDIPLRHSCSQLE